MKHDKMNVEMPLPRGARRDDDANSCCSSVLYGDIDGLSKADSCDTTTNNTVTLGYAACNKDHQGPSYDPSVPPQHWQRYHPQHEEDIDDNDGYMYHFNPPYQNSQHHYPHAQHYNYDYGYEYGSGYYDYDHSYGYGHPHTAPPSYNTNAYSYYHQQQPQRRPHPRVAPEAPSKMLPPEPTDDNDAVDTTTQPRTVLPPPTPPSDPTLMCCYHKRGVCKKGSACWYSHEGSESTPCHYGVKCVAGHSTLSRTALSRSRRNVGRVTQPSQPMTTTATTTSASKSSMLTSAPITHTAAPPSLENESCRFCDGTDLYTVPFRNYTGGGSTSFVQYRVHCSMCHGSWTP
eukprot:PhM_4_TR616/c0_g1_i1/m.82824